MPDAEQQAVEREQLADGPLQKVEDGLSHANILAGG